MSCQAASETCTDLVPRFSRHEVSFPCLLRPYGPSLNSLNPPKPCVDVLPDHRVPHESGFVFYICFFCLLQVCPVGRSSVEQGSTRVCLPCAEGATSVCWGCRATAHNELRVTCVASLPEAPSRICLVSPPAFPANLGGLRTRPALQNAGCVTSVDMPTTQA